MQNVLHFLFDIHLTLIGASHQFLYVHISSVTVVSHRHHFGSGFEP